jgi:hypothetical protein
MPTITRTFIKTAMGYALLGTVLSTIWLLNVAWSLHPLLGLLQPTALHLLVVGWLTQLIFGVALWMFPTWSRAQPRGPDGWTWACYALLNIGLVLRLVAEPLNTYRPVPAWGFMLLVSALVQVAAILIFVALAWRRVRAKHRGAR